MDNSTFKFVITHQGKIFLKKLLRGMIQKIDFLIALGGNNQFPSLEDTRLFEEKIRVQATVNTPNEEEFYLQAYFPIEYAADQKFDIYEIGVFVQTEENNSILLGRCASEKIIAKKSYEYDLSINLKIDFYTIEQENNFNIIIDHLQNPNYPQNNYQEYYASEKKYGLARLATKKDIMEKTPQRILTTDLIPYFVNDQNETSPWSSSPPTNISMKEGANLFMIGAHFIDLEKRGIMVLMARETNQNNDSNNNYLYYSIYNLNNKNESITLRKKMVSGQIPYQRIKANPYHQKKLSFLININEEHDAEGEILKQVFFEKKINIDSSLTTDEDDDSKEIYYNELHYSSVVPLDKTNYLLLGGSKKALRTAELIGALTFNNKIKNISLISKRKYPLVERIGDSIYIIGGNKEKDKEKNTPPHPVEILNINQQDSMSLIPFIPITPPIDELQDTSHAFSCVNGTKIYIFFSNYFSARNVKSRYYYQYDTLSNIWKKKTIPDAIYIPEHKKILSGSAVSTDHTIHLFFLTSIKDETGKLFHITLVVNN